MKNEITIIFVNYYLDKMIIENIKNLKDFKIIIVDNNKKSCLEKKIKNFDNINYFKNSKNIGEGAAANMALNKVQTKYTLYLNPDTFIDKTNIINLYKKYLEYPSAAIIAPLHFRENKFFYNFKPHYFDEYKISRNMKDTLILKKINSTIPIGDLSSKNIWVAPIFFNTEIIKKIGFFDENFFLYFEDNDLCDRIYLSNMEVVITTNAKCIHLNYNIKPSYKNLFITTFSFINSQLYYFKKNKKNNFFLILRVFEYSVNTFKYLFFLNLKKSYVNFIRVLAVLFYIIKKK